MNTNENTKQDRLIEQMGFLGDLNQNLQKMIDTRTGNRQQFEEMADRINQVNHALSGSGIPWIDGEGFLHGDTGLEATIKYARKLRDENTEQIHKMLKEFADDVSGKNLYKKSL
jgi:hypothetical protein